MGSLTRGFRTTSNLVVSAGLVVVGSLAATVATDWLKRNLVDFDARGGDAVYPFLTSMGMLALWNTRVTRQVALGMIASSVTVAAEDFGLA